MSGFLESIAHAIADTLRGRRDERRWWVEPIAPEDLGKGPDAIALVYHEGDRQLWLHGVRGRDGALGRVDVPSREAWAGAVEPWARGRRDELLQRIALDARVRGRFELVERAAGRPA